MLLHDKLWTFRKESNKNVRKFAKDLRISNTTAQLLLNRGIEDIEKARIYLDSNPNNLHNPFLLKDADIAVSRIKKAIELGEKICIYGSDYIDGVSCIVILYKFLRSINCKVNYSIYEEKEVNTISDDTIDSIKSMSGDLIIFVDCGLTSNTILEHINSLEIDFIIIDNIDYEDNIPDATAVLNPKRKDCSYPYDRLSCVGIGLKLLQGLIDRELFHSQLINYLDIVALGTVAEDVPVTGENRILLKNGLKVLNETKDNILKVLLGELGIKNENINIEDVKQLTKVLTTDGKIHNPLLAIEFLTASNLDEVLDILNELINFVKINNSNGIYFENEKSSVNANAICANNSAFSKESKNNIIEIDMEIDIKAIGFNLIEEINMLAPFGPGNPKPVFSFRKITVENVDFVGEDKEHLMLLVQEENRVFDCIGFDLGSRDLNNLRKERIDLAFNLGVSTFKGIETIQLNINDLRRRNELCYKDKMLIRDYYQSFAEKSKLLGLEPEKHSFGNVKDLRNIKDRARYVDENINLNKSNLILINTIEGLIELSLYLSDTDGFGKIDSISFNFPKCSTSTIVVNPVLEDFDFKKYENIYMYDIPLLRGEINILLDCGSRIHLLYNKDDCKVFHRFLGNSIPKRDDLVQLYKYLRKFPKEDPITLEDFNEDLINMDFVKLRFSLEILLDAKLVNFSQYDEKFDIELLKAPKEKIDITATARYREINLIKDNFENHSIEAFARKFK